MKLLFYCVLSTHCSFSCPHLHCYMQNTFKYHKISDIFNSSLQNPIDFICTFCIHPIRFTLSALELILLGLHCAPRQGFCVTQHLCLMHFQLQDLLH